METNKKQNMNNEEIQKLQKKVLKRTRIEKAAVELALLVAKRADEGGVEVVTVPVKLLEMAIRNIEMLEMIASTMCSKALKKEMQPSAKN